jgi:superfamily II DNA or RNA helicase/very-short-patch-repair endonuclease/ribosomal protein L37AE/L43A
METKIHISEYKHLFDDLDVAIELGKKLWDKDSILDFSEIESVPLPFLRALLETAFEKRDSAFAIQFVDIESMVETVQNEFSQVYSALGKSNPSSGVPDAIKPSSQNSVSSEASEVFNPFSTLEDIQKDYLAYVHSFQQIKSEEIKAWIEARLEEGGLLWKPPYLQIALPFLPGDSLQNLVDEGVLHPKALGFARQNLKEINTPPIDPYRHQVEAIRKLHQGRNVIVATGTGSGKSFSFGIPIVSTALKMKAQGIQGIKAVIVYPMNALANNQYDDFSERLQQSGLKIARYTGDTKVSPDTALSQHKTLTGREEPWDCEVLSREEIQNNPPDILMTNYVMLELLLTRFEDRKLFRHQGVLKYLVLDEVHTYSGKQGADVAALIRRLKQHTGTIGELTCIGTSATVESGEDESAQEAISQFARDLFGEEFTADDVVGESYAPIEEGLNPKFKELLAFLQQSGPQPSNQLAEQLKMSETELTELILGQPEYAAKVHAFFSQGRPIHSCVGQEKHLNDRGESLCPTCAEEDKSSPTFPLVFCRSCGVEYYSITRFDDNTLAAAELDSIAVDGQTGYLMILNEDVKEGDFEIPESWLTKAGNLRSDRQENMPTYHSICREHGELDHACGGEKSRVMFIPAPFLFCPECGVGHDRRSREFGKLFSYGTVGRSTATDLILNAELRNLPEGQQKVIAFSDNRQDTALQAAHINSMSDRLKFRRQLYNTLQDNQATLENNEIVWFKGVGLAIYNTLDSQGLLPKFDTAEKRVYGRAAQNIITQFQQYLGFLTLRELEGTHRRIHQNLEDTGILVVGYDGLNEFSADVTAWESVPYLNELSIEKRYDVLYGIMDMMRLRLAIKHDAIIRPDQFYSDVISRINQDIHSHDGTFFGAIGFSDDAPSGRNHKSHRLTSGNTQINRWLRKFLPLNTTQAGELIATAVEKLVEVGFLVTHEVRDYGRILGHLYIIDPSVITMQLDTAPEKQICPRCSSVYHFEEVHSCYRTTCRGDLVQRDISQNYFLETYTQPLGSSVDLHAEEHSGQVTGDVRMDIEQRFRDPESDLNVIVCTPTMELGIDIGDLNVVALRNIPPSPSNYAQRAGRAGRKGQSSLITAYAGVGFARGPHDQYFFRFPEKMISGAISAPRFRLDNKYLITAHIHSLVLEVLGKGLENPTTGKPLSGLKLPPNPNEILSIDHEHYAMLPDLRNTWESAIKAYAPEIREAVLLAFANELEHFDWFTEEFINGKIEGFVRDLDAALDYWRTEYHSLYQEGREIEDHLLMIQGDKARNDRMSIISSKLTAMRNGKGDWYIYRYLGSQGFLPGYAFPPQSTYLSFYNSEDEIGRNPTIAISEFAPGNYIYYRGNSYKIVSARAKTVGLSPSTYQVLVCPECEQAYVGAEETNIARCSNCGQDLQGEHSKAAIILPNMAARKDAKISSDEEERRRLGYEITTHYRGGGREQQYILSNENSEVGNLILENSGNIFIMNHGRRKRDGTVTPFALCSRCNNWLLSEKEIEKHFSTTERPGECRSNAKEEDVLNNIGLTHEFQSDILILEIPLPDGENPESFYRSLITAVARGIMIAFNLDENEVRYFLAPNPDNELPYRMVFYETSLGGTGSLASMTIASEFNRVMSKMHEILHGNDDAGCEGACYQCLLSFYNQRDHHYLNRQIVLNWLDETDNLEINQIIEDDEPKYQELLEKCDSHLEKDMLREMRDRKIRLPDEAQKVIYGNEGNPIVSADFYYEPKIVVFVDGSHHHLDYVQAGDEKKRRKLRSLGYRMVVIKGEDIEEGLTELVKRIG